MKLQLPRHMQLPHCSMIPNGAALVKSMMGGTPVGVTRLQYQMSKQSNSIGESRVTITNAATLEASTQQRYVAFTFSN
jgi:hypothetical protein